MTTPPRPVLQIEETSDPTPITHDGDAVARGSIGADRVLTIRGSLNVEGDLRAAQVSVGGVATVGGVIDGGKTGRYSVSGHVQCQAISGGSLTTQAAVRVAGDVEASRVTCCGRLDVGGAIRGADVAANGGITCGSLGASNGWETLIEVGEGRTLQLLVQSAETKIKADRSQTAAARMALGPMLENIRLLSPQERERVTEMLADAEEAEAQAAKLVAAFERRKRLITQQADARIAVKTIVHPGVHIRIGCLEAVLTKPITGPMAFLKRTNEGRPEIIAVDDTSGIVTVLAVADTPPAAAA